MAKNKKYNRESEFLFQDVEFLSIYSREIGTLNNYPVDELKTGWETILTNQFHDILPGTSIKKVYEDSHKQYEEVLKSGKSMVDKALQGIADGINLEERSLVLFNQLGFERDDIIEFDSEITISALKDPEGNQYPVQSIGDNRFVAFVRAIPSKGYKSLTYVTDSKEKGESPFSFEDNLAESPYYKIHFDSCGNMDSIFDRKN